MREVKEEENRTENIMCKGFREVGAKLGGRQTPGEHLDTGPACL